jgi:hypothetical protein
MSDGPAVAKTVWTDADFDAMGWHDNAVHAIAVEPAPPHPGSLLLDIDYIVEWVPRPGPGGLLSSWVCPATLVFHQAWDLVTEINLHGWGFQLSIGAIERSGPGEHGLFAWTIGGDLFSMSFSAVGFTQYLRRAPIYLPGQRLSVEERGGLSFGQQGYAS